MKSTMPIGALTAAAREGLAGNWGKSIGVLVVYMILLVGVSLIPFAGWLLQLIFSAPLAVGLTVFFLATVRKQSNPFRLLFAGFTCFGTSICTYLLIGLICLAWAILFFAFMIPLFLFMKTIPLLLFIALETVAVLGYVLFMFMLQMRYSLALYVVADDPSVGARQAIRRGVELMKGNYWRLGLLWLRFTGWILLGILTLGIGFVWLGPYYMASITAFYDDLSTNG